MMKLEKLVSNNHGKKKKYKKLEKKKKNEVGEASHRIMMQPQWPEPYKHDHLTLFDDDELRVMTDNYNPNNLLGRTLLGGEVCRGKTLDENGSHIDVSVKVWKPDGDDSISTLKKEITFLDHPDVNHPYIPKLLGCCFGYEFLGIVYRVQASGILEHLAKQDSLTWADRLHIALKFANLVQYLHGFRPSFLVPDICPAHIIIDQAKNPVLYEFGTAVGGIFQDIRSAAIDELHGDFDHIDPVVVSTGVWCKACDVRAYGVILLSLLRSEDAEHYIKIDGETWNLYKHRGGRFWGCRPNFSIDTSSFQFSQDF